MCGRYAANRDARDLVEELEVDQDRSDEPAGPQRPRPVWNVAPTASAAVVLERAPRGQPGADPERQLRRLVWGLVPSWSKDSRGGARMINARAETLLQKPSFRRAAAARRCLVPADGWFEWLPGTPVGAGGRNAGGSRGAAKPVKQPFHVHHPAGELLTFAGVYEFWRDEQVPEQDPAAWWVTFAVVTTAAQGHLQDLHERMPLLVPREHRSAWLDPSATSAEHVEALLTPPPVDQLAITAVSTRVNDVRHDTPDLVDPVVPPELVGLVDPATGELLVGDDGD